METANAYRKKELDGNHGVHRKVKLPGSPLHWSRRQPPDYASNAVRSQNDHISSFFHGFVNAVDQGNGMDKIFLEKKGA
jgi:hypothetical protein